MICILLFYLIGVSRIFFLQSLCLTLLDMMINVALKGTFKLPLLTDGGFAFPSGHMQITTVFYGWLALYVPSLVLRCLMLVVCIGQGMGLIHYHYHNLMDVIGGFIVGVLLIVSYRGILSVFKRHTPWILILISTGCMLYNMVIYQNGIPMHAKYAYELLLGVLLCERILSKNGKNTHDWEPINVLKVTFL